jgi:signal transduction histidine kinase
VIVSGEPLVINDVPEQVKEPTGVYYDVDKEGQMRKVPEEGPPGVRSAMMLPVKHEGEVVGVVQLMHEHFEYGPEHLELAEGLVGLMAAAVRNALLYERAQTEAAARARAEATAAEREHASRVLEAVGDGIFLLDDERRIRFWNRAAELVTGRDRDGVLDLPAGDVFVGWDALAEEISVSAGWAPARSVTLPVELDGRELWLSFIAVRSSSGIVYAFRDLTIERRLDEAKSDFVASISHELRTPMTAVLGAAMTLLREDIELEPERRRQLLEMISSQGRRLTQITEDVLLASRLDRGDLQVEREPVDLGDLAKRAVETMREQTPESVTLKTAPNGSATAVGDPDRTAARSRSRRPAPRDVFASRWPTRGSESRPRSTTPSSRSSTAAPRAGSSPEPASASTSAGSWCGGWAARSACDRGSAAARPSSSSFRPTRSRRFGPVARVC